MNDERREAYITLIEALLNCQDEEEFGQILSANPELLDVGLLETVARIAQSLAEQGEEKAAEGLMYLGSVLMQVLGLSEEETPKLNPQDYIEFLLDVFGVIAESKGNSEVVYPFLQNHLDKLDDTLADILYLWATNLFPSLEAETANGLAAIIVEFGNLIAQFPLGSRKSNLEIAIKGYQAALEVYTRAAFPVDWAMTQNNLGNAYRNRIRGEKAENIEEAISSYRHALEIYTRAAFPVDWATTQNNLGAAYSDRIRGEKAENIEEAISSYRHALEIYTRAAFPVDWATTQNNLGAAYSDRIRGEKAENIEEAISSYRHALEIYTRAAFPVDWATTQNNLGAAYSDRIRGEKAENIEEAISSYRHALEIRTRAAFPVQWATTQNNLGAAYSDRIRGEKAENIEEAISSYRHALEIYTRAAFPVQWATTQNNLGAAYSDRIRGEKAENIEEAISSYRHALEIYTRAAFPVDWAMTQNNLGNAYSDRIRGEKAENIEEAISSYRHALEIYTRAAFPVDWAMTQNNLGNAYRDRIRGEKAENIEVAISSYRHALEIYTRAAFPVECLQTNNNLGKLYFRESAWQNAIEAYNNAIEALSISRASASTPQRKQLVMEASINVYHNIIQAYLNNGQKRSALEYVERSKTQNLVEQITTQQRKPKGDIPQDIIKELNRLRHDIRNEQNHLDSQERQNPNSPPDRTRLYELLQELEQFIEESITPLDPTFKLTEAPKPISYEEIKALIDDHAAILEWYITGDKILAFIITHNQDEPIVWQSENEDRDKLIDWTIDEYLIPYDENFQDWQTDLDKRLTQLAKILHLDEILSLIPPECEKLILIPHWFLHLLPLHALPVGERKDLSPNPSPTRRGENITSKPSLVSQENTGENFTPISSQGRGEGGVRSLLIDVFPQGVNYIPSCQLLQIVQQRQHQDFNDIFMVANPEKNLNFTEVTVNKLKSLFNTHTLLTRESATQSALANHPHLLTTHCLHFYCHGKFNFTSPLESKLALAASSLSLKDIFNLFLPQCRLVTLCACETGVTDLNTISDEYVGLPSGFLFAGSESVVSSLWTVDELSSIFLMIEFYNKLRAGNSVTLALNAAQTRIRNLSKQDLEKWLHLNQLSLDATQIEYLDKLLKQSPEYPFQSSYHWAAFCAIGK
ncbi:CHAT domain-containing protein [Gloeothece verrucosa]|uniref:TPR repeat-containing protein n=1 Tax=Gloeothece verrucosa (strain PCC 7822) TaxID=497965 RepID=E0UE03_GLOV7|nr:CHAT domain-containing tetratricopeptide repeat protein [Gloeothece verrucosa]ADN13007.1 TPR repeat-containing protein [Gloeothece verrucosa PCC 7822]